MHRLLVGVCGEATLSERCCECFQKLKTVNLTSKTKSTMEDYWRMIHAKRPIELAYVFMCVLGLSEYGYLQNALASHRSIVIDLVSIPVIATGDNKWIHYSD
ncbi:hypothetical protein TNCV_1596481 [Trichonephila clavipes]|nr:hypothetical protein TNCV_1596481 [Trichonephila clavipes]